MPSNIVTSDQLEAAFAHTLARLGLPPGQVEMLSGVKQRRWFDEGTMPSEVAAIAGQRALDDAGVDISQVDVLINTSVSRDYLEPATAAMVAGQLGLSHRANCFDLTNACLGFLNGLATAADLITLGHADRVLVTNAECVRAGVSATLQRLASPEATVDTFRSQFATLTLGSGAVAALVTHERLSKRKHYIRGAVMRSATEHNKLCLGNPTEMRSDAHGLLTHGVALAVETWPAAHAELGWESTDDIDVFICHQVSLAHFTSSFKQMGLPLDKAPLTFPYIGNCGPASVPLTLALCEDQGRVKPGMELCLYGVGSGLGCIIMGVSW